LKEYHPGEAFGELALLYNAPRAASILAKTDCTLFALDRETFNHIVKDAARKKREKFEDALKKVTILEQIDPYFRIALADGIKDTTVKAGETIIKYGDRADKFYMIAEGHCVASKADSQNNFKEVYKFDVGDYFGELALLRNIPR